MPRGYKSGWVKVIFRVGQKNRFSVLTSLNPLSPSEKLKQVFFPFVSIPSLNQTDMRAKRRKRISGMKMHTCLFWPPAPFRPVNGHGIPLSRILVLITGYFLFPEAVRKIFLPRKNRRERKIQAKESARFPFKAIQRTP